MAVRKHEKGAIFKENQRISNAFRIAGVRSTRESGREKEKPAKEKLGLILKKEGKTHEYSKSS